MSLEIVPPRLEQADTIELPIEEAYLDPTRLVLDALPDACKNCISARRRVGDLAWTLAMSHRTSPDKLASLIREQTGCSSVENTPDY